MEQDPTVQELKGHEFGAKIESVSVQNKRTCRSNLSLNPESAVKLEPAAIMKGALGGYNVSRRSACRKILQRAQEEIAAMEVDR